MIICVIKGFLYVRRSWNDMETSFRRTAEAWQKVRDSAVNQITVTGMVLSSVPIGEYDKRVVILTKERGKIAAFARGARKQSSPLGGSVMPFSFGEFTIYEGRTSYTMVSASISNYFAELRNDVEGAYYGFYFMDIANYYAKEANDETKLLKLLYQTFRALVKPSIPNRLIRCIFELKAISINGEGPQVFGCLVCGDKERPVKFSVKRGGLVCGECDKGIYDGVRLHPSTIYTMQYIISTPVEKLYTFNVTGEVLEELQYIIGKYMDAYVDKSFKSLEILEGLINV